MLPEGVADGLVALPDKGRCFIHSGKNLGVIICISSVYLLYRSSIETASKHVVGTVCDKAGKSGVRRFAGSEPAVVVELAEVGRSHDLFGESNHALKTLLLSRLLGIHGRSLVMRATAQTRRAGALVITEIELAIIVQLAAAALNEGICKCNFHDCNVFFRVGKWVKFWSG